MALKIASVTGNLSNPATFGGSAFVAGDHIQVNNGITLTIDQNAQIGNAFPNAGNYAIEHMGTTARTVVAANITASLQGRFRRRGAYGGGVFQDIQLNAGSILEFNVAASPTPSTNDYGFVCDDVTSYAAFGGGGTQANKARIRSVGSGRNARVETNLFGNYFDCSHIVFERLGDANSDISVGFQANENGRLQARFCKFLSCGRLNTEPGVAGNQDFSLEGTVFEDSQHATDSARLNFNGNSTGLRQIGPSFFDKQLQVIGACDTVDLRGVVAWGGIAASSNDLLYTFFEDNFFRQTGGVTARTANYRRNVHLDPLATNCRGMQPHPGIGQAIQDNVFWASNPAAIDGDLIAFGLAPSAARTYGPIDGNLVIGRSGDRRSIGKLCSLLGDANTTVSQFARNVGASCGGTHSNEAALLAFGETYAGRANMITGPVSGNVAYSDLAARGALIAERAAGASTVQNIADPAQITTNVTINGFAGTDGNGLHAHANGNAFSTAPAQIPVNLTSITRENFFKDINRDYFAWAASQGFANSEAGLRETFLSGLDQTRGDYNATRIPSACWLWCREGHYISVAGQNALTGAGLTPANYGIGLAPPSAPTISTINGLAPSATFVTPQQGGIVVTGTNFGANNAARSWFGRQGSLTRPLTEQAGGNATQATLANMNFTTPGQASFKHGEIEIGVTVGAESVEVATLIVPDNLRSYADIVDLHPVPSERLPLVVLGAQVELVAVVGSPVTTVFVNGDGTVSRLNGVPATAFSYRVWDPGDQTWGVVAERQFTLSGLLVLVGELTFSGNVVLRVLSTSLLRVRNLLARVWGGFTRPYEPPQR